MPRRLTRTLLGNFASSAMLRDPRRNLAQILSRRRHIHVDDTLDLIVIDFGRRLNVDPDFHHVNRAWSGSLQIRRAQRNLLQIDQIVNRRPCRARNTARSRK